MSLYIENILETIANNLLSGNEQNFNGVISDKWTIRFIASVYDQIDREKALSTEQVKVILGIIKKVEDLLVEYKLYTKIELQAILANPKFIREPYKSTFIPREVRHLGLNLLGFRFKYNPDIVSDLKLIRQRNMHSAPYFDSKHGLWIFPVTRNNLRDAIDLIKSHRFSTDVATDRWLALAKQSHGMVSVFELHENIVVAKVKDNEILALWMQSSLGAEPL